MSEKPETMTEKCATCAFRPGTRASNSPLTVLKARMCAQIGHPFHCHENAVFVTPSGKIIDPEDHNRFDFIGPGRPPGEYQPPPGEDWKDCAGWAELYATLEAKGLVYREGWQKELTERLLEVIEKAETLGEAWDDERSAREVRAVVDSMQEVYGR